MVWTVLVCLLRSLLSDSLANDFANLYMTYVCVGVTYTGGDGEWIASDVISVT